MDSFLTELRQTLDRLGYVTVPHGDHLCVRLALFASVRIYSSAGAVRLVPQFGPFSRTAGVLLTSSVGLGAVGGTAFTLGIGPWTLLAGFLGVMALAHDACRFVLTEACLTRLQQLVLDVQRAHPLALPASPLREVGREHGVDVVAQPASRSPVPVHRPGQ